MTGLSKRGRRIALGVTAGVVVLGVGLWVRRADAKPLKADKVSPTKAVNRAFRQLGGATSKYALTEFAYALAYPRCPAKLDPKNAEHQGCIDKWNDLLTRVESKKKTLPASEQGKKRPPVDKLGSKLLQWWGTLNRSQQRVVKEVLGAGAVNGSVRAAQEGNDAQVAARLSQLQRTFERQSQLAQAQAYLKLKNALGEAKLDAFLEIVS